MMFFSKAVVSPPGTVNKADLVSWVKTNLVFLVPALIIIIPSVVSIIPPSWKYAAITLWILNTLLALLLKFQNGSK